MAASAVGAGVGQAVGGQLGNSFGGRLATGLIAGTAAAVARGGKVAIQQVAMDAFGNVLGSSLAEAMGPQPESRYSLASGDSGQGLRPGVGSSTGLSYGGQRASAAMDDVSQYGRSSFTPDLDASTIADLRERLGLPSPAPDVSWQLAAGPTSGRSLGGYGPGAAALMGPMTRDRFRRLEIEQMNTAGIDSSSSWLGATAGVASSFGSMAAGTARVGSNMLMQIGNVLTGGFNNDHPVMQQVYGEQRALGQGIVNLVSSPVATATNLIEGVVNRYDSAQAQPSDFDRSYELGRLFNDVGQAAVGGGLAIRGVARLGASGLESLRAGAIADGQAASAAGSDMRLGLGDAMLADSELLTNRPSGLNQLNVVKNKFKGGDLVQHLGEGGPHVKTVYGAHRQDAFEAALIQLGGWETAPRVLIVDGIYEASYVTGKGVNGTKTIYDSAKFSDQKIFEMSNTASQQAWNAYAQTGRKLLTTKIDGVPFRTLWSFDKQLQYPTVYSHPGR